MDLTGLVTQKNADDGIWFQAILYGRKQPFDINILGADSDKVQKFAREMTKERLSTAKQLKNKDEIDDSDLDSILDTNDDDVIVRINGLRSRDKDPLTMNGVELTSDEKSYRLLIKSIPEVKQFVLKKSNERTNFLSDRKKS